MEMMGDRGGAKEEMEKSKSHLRLERRGQGAPFEGLMAENFRQLAKHTHSYAYKAWQSQTELVRKEIYLEIHGGRRERQSKCGRREERKGAPSLLPAASQECQCNQQPLQAVLTSQLQAYSFLGISSETP